MSAKNVAIGQLDPAPYDGVHIRRSLDEPKGSQCLCPDIIQSDAAVHKPDQVFSTPASWAQMYSTDPVMGDSNNYYVRGLNSSSELDSGTMSLYWAPAQVFNFPAAWKGNAMTTADGSDTAAYSAGPGQVAVGSEGFVWTPPAMAAGSSYYNFIAASADANHPVAIPTVASWLDLADLLANQPAWAFRNQCMVDGAARAWYKRQMLSVPAAFGTAQMQFMLSATGFAGTRIGLLCDSFTPSGKSIQIAPFIVAGDGGLTGAVGSIEGGYCANLVVQCWNLSGKPLKPGSSLTLTVTYAVPKGPELDDALDRGLVSADHGAALRLALGGIDILPTQVAVVANITFTVAAEAELAGER